MQNQNCSKCGGEMDEGNITRIGYVSKKQTGFAIATQVQKVRACLQCGFLEWYLDPQELRQKIGK